ncbi:MAG: methyltransferase domain-containing protein [Clostridia bacterium]|nr:methyltransferase domain-containing protein [Clostridia bacterium]
MKDLFVCPQCKRALIREESLYRCSAGHCFDMAKEGYVNLLPVQQRHSKTPGDDKTMVAARTRFLDGGWYAPLRDKLCRLVDRLGGKQPVLLDAGCGEGYYTAALAQVIAAHDGQTVGVDLSKAAVRRTAKRCPDALSAVASVYHLPLADASVDLLVNCFSPLAIEEFRRVLRAGGYFLYVVPGARHLWELKEILYENPYENEEKQEAYDGFQLLSCESVESRFTLQTREDVESLFHMTPYTWKTPKEGAARLSEVNELTVTAQFRIYVYRKTKN